MFFRANSMNRSVKIKSRWINQPKCYQARKCQVLRSPWWCLVAGQHVVAGSDATALQLCPHYIRVSNGDGIQCWVLHPQTSSAFPYHSYSLRIRVHSQWPRRILTVVENCIKASSKMEHTNRIRSMKRGRQAWRQWLSLEQAHLKCLPMTEKKRRAGSRITIKAFMATARFQFIHFPSSSSFFTTT